MTHEILEGKANHQRIPFSWAPQVAYMVNLEKRIAFLEQVLLDGRTITMKTKDGKKIRVKLSVQKEEVEVPLA